MTAMTDAREMPVRLAPTPVVSGSHLNGKQVTQVVVEVSLDGGDVVRIELEQRHGGYWVPANRFEG